MTPERAPLMTRTGWAAFLVALIAVCAVAPVLNLLVPADSVFHLSDYAVSLVGKIMCYAICALAMDLIWGYTGILSLGHGLFFALGGYAMGMYLMRQIGRDGNYKSDLPDFMVFLDWKELPWHWTFSDSFLATLVLVVAVPGLVAFVFGYFAFRSRIKGVYFSIITQAMTFAAMLLFFRNETGFGGNNGFTDFKRILGMPLATPSMRMITTISVAMITITSMTMTMTTIMATAWALHCCRSLLRLRTVWLQPSKLQCEPLPRTRRPSHVVRRSRPARSCSASMWRTKVASSACRSPRPGRMPCSSSTLRASSIFVSKASSRQRSGGLHRITMTVRFRRSASVIHGRSIHRNSMIGCPTC